MAKVSSWWCEKFGHSPTVIGRSTIGGKYECARCGVVGWDHRYQKEFMRLPTKGRTIYWADDPDFKDFKMPDRKEEQEEFPLFI